MEGRVDQDKTAKQAIVENQINIEMIAFQGNALLLGDEAKALAKLKQKRFQSVDDRLFQVALSPPGPFLQPQELEDEGILEHVGGCGDSLTLIGQGSHLLLVAAFGETLVEQRSDLTLQFANRPVVLGGLDNFVSGRGSVDMHSLGSRRKEAFLLKNQESSLCWDVTNESNFGQQLDSLTPSQSRPPVSLCLFRLLLL